LNHSINRLLRLSLTPFPPKEKTKTPLSTDHCAGQINWSNPEFHVSVFNFSTPFFAHLFRFTDVSVCISATPAALDRYSRGVTGHVARPSRSIQRL
jgi:hypothetical protein